MAPFMWDTLGRWTACAQCVYEVMHKTQQRATNTVEMELYVKSLGFNGMKRGWLGDCMGVYADQDVFTHAEDTAGLVDHHNAYRAMWVTLTPNGCV